MKDADAVALLRAAGHSDNEIALLLAEKPTVEAMPEKEVHADLLELRVRLEQIENDLSLNPAAIANALQNVRMLRAHIVPPVTRIVYSYLGQVS